MQIAKDTVVTIDYELFGPAGEVLDSSRGGEALAYLHGHGQLVPGLEAALAGSTAGAELEVDVSVEQGYGPRDDTLVIEVARGDIGIEGELPVGEQLWIEDPSGEVSAAFVTAVEGERVTLDGNHPLAGIPLRFAVRVVGVRPATREELAHGHVHGAGGHHHH